MLRMHFLVLTLQVLHCGTVWDGAGHAYSPGEITIQDDKIQSVGAAHNPPQSGQIHMDAEFCMPGLVDAHTHVTSYVEHQGDSEALRRDWAVRNAKATLDAGVTSGRDLGDDNSDGIWIRDQINSGKVPGPRLQVACDQIGTEPAHQKMTPDQLRELVRAQVKKGCDVIKLFATTGMGGTDRFLSKAQLAAAVDEAHKHKRRVAVHVIGHDVCVDTVAAGADSVEHGAGVDVALAKEMKKKGVFFTPTLYILRYYVEDAPNIEFGAEEVAKLKHSIATVVEPFEKKFPEILKTGVRIAGGSDSFMKLHGHNANEMVWLVKAGMKPEAALEAMTHTSADLMGWGDRVGKLAPGYFADVVGLDGDPRKDITRVEAKHVTLVIKGGKKIK
jgi:imidazolonepropionase-like amidohydrolase